MIAIVTAINKKIILSSRYHSNLASDDKIRADTVWQQEGEGDVSTPSPGPSSVDHMPPSVWQCSLNNREVGVCFATLRAASIQFWRLF